MYKLLQTLEPNTEKKSEERFFFFFCLSPQIVNCNVRICPVCFLPTVSCSAQGLDACILLICEVESPVSFLYGDYRSPLSVFYLAMSFSALEKIYFSEQDYSLKYFSCFYLKHSW